MSGIPSWARVGAKVVCTRAIERVPPELVGRVSLPALGNIYTIRSVRFGQYDPEPCILLAEIENDRVRVEDDRLMVAWNGEPHFGVRIFRPLITQSDDVEAHFRKLLDVPVTREREGV